MTRPQVRQSLYFTAARRVEVRPEPLPPGQPGQLLVRTLLSAISPGTELLVYRDQLPPDLPLDATLPALSGPPVYPLKYGYACVGHVEAAADGKIAPAWQDRLVFAFHPHESHFWADPAELLPVPPGLTAAQALLLPNMETAVNFLLDGRPLIGERVVVFGQGVVGLLTTGLLARLPLARLVSVEPIPLRRRLSLQLGAHQALDPQPAGSAEALQALLAGLPTSGADLIYELSGAPAVLNQAVAAAAFSARIVVGSWYGVKQAELALGGRFHRSRIQLVSSQVSSIEPALTARWDKARRLEVAWSMLAGLDPEPLISQRVPLAAAAEIYRLIDGQPERTVQPVLTYAE